MIKQSSHLIATAGLLALGATAAFAMESKPAEEPEPPRERMEQLGKDATSVAKEQGLKNVDALKSSFSGNKEAQSLLEKAVSSWQGKEDATSIEMLNKLGDIEMTDGQKQLYDELKNEVDVFALGRNFDTADPAVSGPVNNAMGAIKSGDTLKAAQSLKEVSELASLTPEQKTLVTEIAAQYSGIDLGGLDNAQKAAGDALKMIEQ
ncbi:MAG: hypothetical protein AAGA45_01610 [Verrucomicrobiota bacterium]